MPAPRADAAPAAAGVIYDIGYRHYDGAVRGRLAVIGALYAHGVRTLFGIGRGERAKIVPWGLFALVMIPAIIDSTVATLSGNQARVIPFSNFFQVTGIFVALFCAGQTPELIGSDRVQRVLTLYFSRPLSRFDYVLARWLSLVSVVFAMLVLPQLVLFTSLVMIGESPWAQFLTEAHALRPILGSALLIAPMLAGLSLLVASLIRRRVYATAAILGVLLLSSAVSAALVELSRERFRYAVLASPMFVSHGVTAWMFDDPVRPRSPQGRARLEPSTYGAAASLLGLAALGLVVVRYKRIET